MSAIENLSPTATVDEARAAIQSELENGASPDTIFAKAQDVMRARGTNPPSVIDTVYGFCAAIKVLWSPAPEELDAIIKFASRLAMDRANSKQASADVEVQQGSQVN